jgi:hypothetical protein
MTELDTPLFIPPADEALKADREEEAATAQLLHSPPRKRSRNIFERAESIRPPQRQPPGVVRDEDYYLSDGSCIILVENTLFNVNPLFEYHINGLTLSRRYTEPFYRRIPLLSVRCSPYPKETS